MEDLVSAPEMEVVDHGAVILHVDPVSDDHRSRHDQLKRGKILVPLPVVIVEKGPSPQIQARRAGSRCRDEGGVSGQSPFRPDFRPVPGASADIRLHRPGILFAEAQKDGSFHPGQFARLFKPLLQAPQVFPVRRGKGVRVFQFHVVRGGIVQTGDEPGVFRKDDSLLRETPPGDGIVQEHRRDARARLAGLSRAGAAVEGGGLGVVGRRTAVTDQENQPGKVSRQPHVPESGFGDGRTVGFRDAVQGGDQIAVFVFAEAFPVRVFDGSAPPQTVPDQLGRRQDPEGFDVGETRRCGRLEFFPEICKTHPAMATRDQTMGLVFRGAGRNFPDPVGRVEQNGKVSFRDGSAKRQKLHQNAKESGESVGAHRRGDRFQSPPERFGTHVDAEHGLPVGATVLPGRRGVAGQGGCQRLLVADFQGPLEKKIDGAVRIGRRRERDEILQGFFPVSGQKGSGTDREEEGVPREADSQNVPDRLFPVFSEFGLPLVVTGPGRPSSDAQKGRVKKIDPPPVGDLQNPYGPVNRRFRRCGKLPHLPGDSPKAHHPGAFVEGGIFQPARIEGGLFPGERPHGLAFVKKCGGKLADPLHDEAGPVLPFDVAQNVAQEEDPADRLRLVRPDLAFEFRERHGMARFLEGLFEIFLPDSTFGEALPVIGAGHGESAPQDSSEMFVGVPEVHVHQTEVGVHRDEVLEWPQRGDAPAGAFHVLGQAGIRKTVRVHESTSLCRVFERGVSRRGCFGEGPPGPTSRSIRISI